MDISAPIVPYVGCAGFVLYSNYKYINDSVFVDLNEDFFRVDIGNIVSLFYAKFNMRLFKISVYQGYLGTLNNMPVLSMYEHELFKLYPSMYYDEFDEVFLTKPEQGFFIVTDPISKLTKSVTVYIREMENDSFFDYKW